MVCIQALSPMASFAEPARNRSRLRAAISIAAVINGSSQVLQPRRPGAEYAFVR